MELNSQNVSQDPHQAQNNVSTSSLNDLYHILNLSHFQAQPGYGGPMGYPMGGGPSDMGPCDEGAMCPPGPGPHFHNQ